MFINKQVTLSFTATSMEPQKTKKKALLPSYSPKNHHDLPTH